jgi:YesN/AraC family two-component response regulator
MKSSLLIVDDEEAIVCYLKELLEPKVDVIYTALNGAEGLDVLKKHEVLCVVSDIKMPVMNGIEFIKAVRANNDDVPFIFFTAFGSQSLMFEAVKYGALDFLNKPKFDDLDEIISRGIDEGFKRKNVVDDKSDLEILENYKTLLRGKL